MNTIGAVREPVQPFSPEEIEAMQSNDSTEHVLNRVRRDAGVKGGDVTLTGVDKTFREQKAEYAHEDGVDGALEAMHHGMDVAAEHMAEHAAGAGALVYGGVAIKLMYEGLKQREKMNQRGAELNRVLSRDEMHNALTLSLDLPTRFKQDELAKRADSTRSSQSMGQKMTGELANHDAALKALLQLHCDEGMHAARDMFASGQDKAILFTMQPSIRARYDADAAFRLGFDALVWAKNDPNTYAETVGALKQRDARYDAAHIPVKG